ncbi:MAG TPA: M56 family metallopeptidase [Blastocatellia bacterium]|nr:M56 family metallopeptidase [Blastocatellia bacterium]
MSVLARLAVLSSGSNVELEFLAGLCFKGLLVLSVSALVVAAMRRRSAAARHLIWTATIAGLLLVPALDLFLPALRLPVIPRLIGPAQVRSRIDPQNLDEDSPLELPAEGQDSDASPAFVQAEQPTTAKAHKTDALDLLMSLPPSKGPDISGALLDSPADQPGPGTIGFGQLLFVVWAVGVLVVMLRVILAALGVTRLIRNAEPVLDDKVVSLIDELARRLGHRRRVLVYRHSELTVPVTWGLARPVILLPSDSLDWSEECARVVLLHELSHIRRRDCLTQMLAHLCCAVHWFNPLAWHAARRLRIEREIACDDCVLEAGTRASDYAGQLVRIAALFEPAAFSTSLAVGMACSELESRVRLILDPHRKRGSIGRGRVLITALLSLAIVVPLSMVRPCAVSADSPETQSAATLTSDAARQLNANSSAPELFAAPNAKSCLDERAAIETRSDAVLTRETLARDAQHAPSRAHEPATEEQTVDRAQDHPQDENADPAQAEKKRAGQSEPPSRDRSSGQTLNQNIDLKVHGVTQEYIDSVKKMGFEDVSVRELVDTKIHAVDQQYMQEALKWGFENLSVRQIVQLKTAGVTSDYVESMRVILREKLSARMVTSLKLNGVTPQYVEEIRKAGYDQATARQLLSLKINGVTATYIRETIAKGYGKLSVEELIQLHMLQITPEYENQLRSVGIDKVPPQKLIQLRMNGVTAGLISELRAMGFNDLTVDQIIRMKMFGVTPSYIRKLRAAGFNNISANRLIELKTSGIDEILLRGSR